MLRGASAVRAKPHPQTSLRNRGSPQYAEQTRRNTQKFWPKMEIWLENGKIQAKATGLFRALAINYKN